MKMSFLECISKRVVLGDGALGTYFFENGVPLTANTDLLNLQDPDLVTGAHADYVRAGAELIETNTFGANRFKLEGLMKHKFSVEDVVAQGVRIAKKVAGDRLFVGGSVGPSGVFPIGEGSETSEKDLKNGFKEVFSVMVDLGVDVVILETFRSMDELLLAIRALREISPAIPLFAQMVFPSGGLSTNGMDAYECAQKALKAGADGFGSNCGRGVKSMIEAFRRLAPLKGVAPLSAFPNAGLPEIVGHRTIYSAQPAYMANGVAEMIKMGARLVGGCCGTTPRHIAEFKKRLHLKGPTIKTSIVKTAPGATSHREIAENAPGAFLRGIPSERLPVLVELDPPMHLDCEPIIKGARELKKVGVNAITLAENPLAVLRCDNLALAHMIKEKVGIEPILHLTCRDRNVLGLQHRIMGAHLLGIRAILAVTGDPASASDQPGTTGVFDLDSVGLVKTISNYNTGKNLAGRDVKMNTDFSIGVAFSYRPKNPWMQIERLRRKRDQGAHFVMTQPLFDAGEIESMMELIGNMGLLIFPGIFPLISARNAEFLHNEVPGINVPKRLRERLWNFDKVEDQRMAGFEMTQELISSVMTAIHGLYIISPLNKWEVARDLLASVDISRKTPNPHDNS